MSDLPIRKISQRVTKTLKLRKSVNAKLEQWAQEEDVLPGALARRVVEDFLNGLAYCHKCGYAHKLHEEKR